MLITLKVMLHRKICNSDEVDLQRFLTQHNISTMLRHFFEWLQHCSDIATLYCAKTRRCESSRVILVPRARRFLVGRLQIKPSGSGDENGHVQHHWGLRVYNWGKRNSHKTRYMFPLWEWRRYSTWLKPATLSWLTNCFVGTIN